MAYLDNFTDDEKALLIRLPYRAGLWIGASDTTGGKDSNEAEKQAIAGIVRGFTEDFLKSEFVEAVMREAVLHIADWDSWNENIVGIPDEVRRGIDIAAREVDHKQVSAFKNSLMDVAMTVAMAYREFDETTPLNAQIRIYTKYWLEYLRSYVTKSQPPIMDQYLNISQDEHKALDRLSRALKIDDVEGLEPSDDEEAA